MYVTVCTGACFLYVYTMDSVCLLRSNWVVAANCHNLICYKTFRSKFSSTKTERATSTPTTITTFTSRPVVFRHFRRRPQQRHRRHFRWRLQRRHRQRVATLRRHFPWQRRLVRATTRSYYNMGHPRNLLFIFVLLNKFTELKMC